MEAQMNMENITFDQLWEELTKVNNQIDLTDRSIEETQTELDKTEQQIETIEKERMKEMRSQIEVAKKTLADKQLVLKDRQELLQARQSYLQKLKSNAGEHNPSSSGESSMPEDMELDSKTTIAFNEKPEVTSDRESINSKLIQELKDGLNDETLCIDQEGCLTENSFTSFCLEIKHRPLEFISKSVDYFRPLLTDEQVNTLEQLPNTSS